MIKAFQGTLQEEVADIVGMDGYQTVYQIPLAEEVAIDTSARVFITRVGDGKSKQIGAPRLVWVRPGTDMVKDLCCAKAERALAMGPHYDGSLWRCYIATQAGRGHAYEMARLIGAGDMLCKKRNPGQMDPSRILVFRTPDETEHRVKSCAKFYEVCRMPPGAFVLVDDLQGRPSNTGREGSDEQVGGRLDSSVTWDNGDEG
ncbi:hypothetical protein CYMTET_33891, partial [Cymbomonas tetramitiformis]